MKHAEFKNKYPERVLSHWSQVRGIKAMDDEPNHFRLFGEIGWDVMDTDLLTFLNNCKGENITIDINSIGGYSHHGLAMYNMLKQHSGEITINIYALAASAAQLVAMAGDKILMGDGAFQFIHRAWSLAVGNATDFEAAAKDLYKLDDELAAIIAKRAGLKEKKAIELMEADSYLNYDECKALGLVDDKLVMDDDKSKSKLDKELDAAVQSSEAFMVQAQCLIDTLKAKEAS